MLICIIVFLPVASAGITDILIDILGTKHLDSAHELEYGGIYIPDKKVQHNTLYHNGKPYTGKIRGWVDVVGYQNMIMINGTYYVNDNNSAIVRHDIWCSPLGWNFYFDYIEVTKKWTTIDEYNTTAKINIELLWHTSSYSTVGGISKDYYFERTTFIDVDSIPIQYVDMNCSNASVDIVIYNNTISPKTTVLVLNLPVNAISVNYTYDNESITHYLGTATQDYTEKNCPYMNITPSNVWQDNSNLSQMNGFVIIPSMNFSKSNLSVVVNDPYASHEPTNISVSEVVWQGPRDTFSPFFAVFISVTGILIIGSLIQLKRLLCPMIR